MNKVNVVGNDRGAAVNSSARVISDSPIKNELKKSSNSSRVFTELGWMNRKYTDPVSDSQFSNLKKVKTPPCAMEETPRKVSNETLKLQISCGVSYFENLSLASLTLSKRAVMKADASGIKKLNNLVLQEIFIKNWKTIYLLQDSVSKKGKEILDGYTLEMERAGKGCCFHTYTSWNTKSTLAELVLDNLYVDFIKNSDDDSLVKCVEVMTFVNIKDALNLLPDSVLKVTPAEFELRLRSIVDRINSDANIKKYRKKSFIRIILNFFIR